MAKSLSFCAHKFDAQIAGYVLMPSHIHLLMFVDGKHLAGFMRDFKKYVAQKVIPVLNIRLDKVWKDSFDRVAIETENVFRIKLEYIHQNPVKAGLVAKPENWEWSSAVDYYTGGGGPIPVYKDWS